MSLGDSIGSSLGRAIGAALSGGSDYASIVENGALASFVTFTRASTATYFDSAGVMQTASADVPRVNYDPATLTLLGFLREPQRTNLLTYSEDFSDAAWTANNTTVTANTTVAPNGTTTADTITVNVSSNANRKQSAACAAVRYTYSIFLRAGTDSAAAFGIYQGGWPAQTGVIISGPGTLAGGSSFQTITGLSASEWTRVAVTTDAAVSAGTIFGYVYPGGVSNTAGDTTICWGAQLEAGSYATSYIPTTSAAVTRSADRVLIATPTTQIGFNTQQGTFYGEFSPVADGVDVMLIGYGSGMQGCGRYSGGSISIHDGTTYRVPSGGSALAAGVEGRFAYSYLSGNTTEDCAFNGTAKTYTSDGDIVSGVTTIDVGASQSGSGDAVHIRTLRYYGRRLSGVEQSAITA